MNLLYTRHAIMRLAIILVSENSWEAKAKVEVKFDSKVSAED